MAQVFLSYAREEGAAARRVAVALEAAGHSVWWDRQVHAGSRFSAEIDAALKAADFIVVLWSRASVESAWVQDEAAYGRDHGRLVPALLGPVEPPLGFRQYQSVDLGKSGRRLDALVKALAGKAAQQEPKPRRTERAAWPAGWPWAAALAGLLVLAGVLWLLLPRGSAGPAHVVSITAGEGGDDVRTGELVRAITADLGRFRAGPLGSLTIQSEDRGSAGADYRVEVSVAGGSDALRGDLRLLSPKGPRQLWSTSLEAPSGRLVYLRQLAVARLGDVLACAVEADPYAGAISSEGWGLYLDGCSRLGELQGDAQDSTALSIFRQVTQKAPEFAPGWGGLALIESLSFPATEPSERRALRRRVNAHLARAKRLDPNFPQTVAAEAFAFPADGNRPGRALAVLDRGLRAHPDQAFLRSIRSIFLRAVGRLNEGVAEAERALHLNPLSPAIRDDYISSLAYAGRTTAAFNQLKEAEAIWPGSVTLESVRYRLDLRYGDPRSALRILEQRGAGDVRPVPMDESWRSFLEARMDPSPAKVEAALDGFRARFRRDQGDVPAYVQALGTFGLVDEAFRALESEVALDAMLASAEVLFRPHMRSIRNDPRFIALAAKLGLVQYWEKSGVWADFCSEPQLPYDCKVEAARLTPEQRRIARFIVG